MKTQRCMNQAPISYRMTVDPLGEQTGIQDGLLPVSFSTRYNARENRRTLLSSTSSGHHECWHDFKRREVRDWHSSML
jgi:hypothetical protein